MKTPKLIKHCVLYSLLIGSLLIIGGCKKEKNQTDTLNKLLGDWHETPVMDSTSRTLHFSKDGTFATIFTYQGTPTAVLKSSGTFKIKGDSLLVTIKEKSIQGSNQPAVVNQVNLSFYDNATFNVTNSTLTIKYTTYPADAPVATEAKFQKQLPD
jgi:hypothetical protein